MENKRVRRKSVLYIDAVYIFYIIQYMIYIAHIFNIQYI